MSTKTTLLGILFLIVNSLTIFAQQTFKYQTVAKDASDNIVNNQIISVQVSIILTNPSANPVYVETHLAESNDYGVINMNVGGGTSLTGNFQSINWEEAAFIKVEMDFNGGTNYSVSNTSEILSVPRSIYAARAGSLDGTQFGLLVTDFGAVGDGVTDDTDAFHAAIDSAAIVGSKVFVPSGIYKITSSLNLVDGVSLIGEGMGSDPLQTPYNGSLIRYEGDQYAVNIIGHDVHLKDIIIRDHSNEQAIGGVRLLADGRSIENVYLFDVLISGFTNGTALKLNAQNSGGIAYATLYHVRIRHGLIGVHIDQDQSSYVNSNSLYHCQVSGGGFDYGVLITGGNNNVFNEVVIEPPVTNSGHLVVKSGRLFGHEIRIEGVNQDPRVPLIFFSRSTKNSTLTGIYAGGLTLDKGNNFINMQSGKAIHYKNSSFNKFRNAVFYTPDGTTLKNWDIDGNGITIEILEPELTDVSNVLKLTIPAGKKVQLEPEALSRPSVKDLPLYDQVNFGFHVKTDIHAIAYVTTNAPQGWTTSTPHSGSGEWEFVSMNAEVNRSQPARFRLEVNNTTSQTIDVYVTTPTLNFGNQLPTLDEPPLFSSGGELTGQLTHAMATAETPSNGFLTLPLCANYFEITNTNNIGRINHQTADRVPKGTVITLLFNEAGVGVTNSGYLQLKSGYNSVANGSLMLISNGNGTWREVMRNN